MGPALKFSREMRRLQEDRRLDQGTGERGIEGGMRGGQDAWMEDFRVGGKEERMEGEGEAGMKVREPKGCVLMGVGGCLRRDSR